MSYTWDEPTQSLGLAEIVDWGSKLLSFRVLGSLITWEPGSEGEHLSSEQVFQEKRVEAALSFLTLTQKSEYLFPCTLQLRQQPEPVQSPEQEKCPLLLKGKCQVHVSQKHVRCANL